MMWFGHVRDNRSCQILSVNGACPSLVILCRADIGQDHSRALRACIRGPPKDWRRRTGSPRQTWLRTVEDDLRPLNFGLATARRRRRAMDRPAWRLLVDAATSSWHAPESRERERDSRIVLARLFTGFHVCHYAYTLEEMGLKIFAVQRNSTGGSTETSGSQITVIYRISLWLHRRR